MQIVLNNHIMQFLPIIAHIMYIVIRSVVGGLTTVIWSVVAGCRSGRWSIFSQPLVGGQWFFRSVVGGSFGWWSAGRPIGGAWSVVGVTVVGGFVLRR